MPNAIWKGHISFGLVSIPIILYSSEDKSTGVSFHQIDKRNQARIRYQRINSVTGNEVPWKEIGKGYEYDKDQIIPVEEGELEKIIGDSAKSVAIESFVDKSHLNYLIVSKVYYLVPDKKGEKGYVILREALKSSGKIGIAKILITTKEYLAAVAVYDDALVIYTLRYADEVKEISSFPIPSTKLAEYHVNKKEIDIAKQLIDSMSEKWNPENYKDDFKLQVDKWLNAKLKKLPMKATKKKAQKGSATNAVNFMDLLKQSLRTKKPAKNDPKFKPVAKAKAAKSR